MAGNDKSIVGDLINFRGLVYAPLNENGVVFLFGKVAHDLNMYVEEIKPGFPDCIARRYIGNGCWERVTIEFEFSSSNFRTHGHNASDCDLIVCWRHDWPDCPVEVIELRSVTQEVEDEPIERPDSDDHEQKLKGLFDSLHLPPSVRELYKALQPQLLSTGEGIWCKLQRQWISFNWSRRLFVYVEPDQHGLRLSAFTRGQPLEGLTPFTGMEGGQRWGKLCITTKSNIPSAIAACQESYKRLLAAAAANERTDWLSKAKNRENAIKQATSEWRADNLPPTVSYVEDYKKDMEKETK